MKIAIGIGDKDITIVNQRTGEIWDRDVESEIGNLTDELEILENAYQLTKQMIKDNHSKREKDKNYYKLN